MWFILYIHVTNRILTSFFHWLVCNWLTVFGFMTLQHQKVVNSNAKMREKIIKVKKCMTLKTPQSICMVSIWHPNNTVINYTAHQVSNRTSLSSCQRKINIDTSLIHKSLVCNATLIVIRLTVFTTQHSSYINWRT